jgi:dipeptidyl aminopeptidase/acylaminoacyl peptidase
VPGGSKIAWLSACLLLEAVTDSAAEGPQKGRITVEDTIRMTTFPETTYTSGESSSNRFARFSPDGRNYVVVTAAGLPETNENEFVLWLFATKDAFHETRPRRILSMRSRSNRDAIKNVRWVGNDTVYFVGEVSGGSQVHSLNVLTGRRKQWTFHPTPVVDFDVDRAGSVIVYAAEPGPPSEASVREKIDHGYTISLEALGEVPASRADFYRPSPAQGEELFVKRRGERAVRVALRDRYLPLLPISIAPGGRHAVFGVFLRDVPASWIDYQDEYVRAEVKAYRRKGSTSWLMSYQLLDTRTMRVEPLLPGPVAWASAGAAWSPDGRSLAISGAFLSLAVSDPTEREIRKKQAFAVEVPVGTGKLEKIAGGDLVVTEWDTVSERIYFRPSSGAPEAPLESYGKAQAGWTKDVVVERRAGPDLPEVVVEQDLNTPPRLYARDRRTGRKNLLLDPNPAFENLAFGNVEAISWKATDGHEVEGGLYLPPDYRPGRRYPLVLQTHGFSKSEFWINGPWNSGYAAQPLAARGIVVLQVGHGSEPGGYQKHHRSLEEAPREMAAYEGAIDALDQKGIIDREHVGILAFSRTQYHVEYTLTHSNDRFRAAILIDGFDGGYLQYLMDPYSEKDVVMVNGGPPYGATLANWLEHSPSFRVDRVRTPVRIECHDWGITGCWEWYALLTHMGKPVELLYLPDAVHLLVKPWERLASQQGSVDWFCFWLKGEEDRSGNKREQVRRWNDLREQQGRERADGAPAP